ncbi:MULTISPECIES: hypothetical protein [Methanobacterium]|jgi:hypothetical protein|uniref:Uncharacterized protein n=1 Tax=Methanobacterium veterum TaxID=408577 RepID=A0A9E5A2W2_9EURY|nr:MULTISPECIES: hypothetical protein [Methanobacterium]MCZ3367080.1 hypothetical protein [Methanobacterium veterum]MCZ3373772.1 hypothetical protein [Methanobacterium veterum]
MFIFYKGEKRTLEEIYEKEKQNPKKPEFLKTIKELLDLEKNEINRKCGQ